MTLNFTCLYVLALYAGAIALARKFVPWRVAALFYALVLGFLFKPMTGAYVNIPTDIIELVSPWSAGSKVTKFNVSNLELHDVTMQIVPWAHQAREAWRHGHVPLWNALNGCGYPLLANGQSSALSPIRILALPLPLGYALTAEAAMKLLIALTFTFVYCRRRGYSEIASVAGAISYAFSMFTIGWLHFPIVTVAAFLPAILHGIDLLAEQRTRARFAFTAIVAALAVFGGHVETLAHIGLLCTLCVAWIAVGQASACPARKDGLKPVLHFAGAVIGAALVAALLAAPLLAPFLEAMPQSQRFHEQKAKPFDAIPYSDRASLVLLLEPKFYGPRPVPWGPAYLESITGFAGILAVASLVALLVHIAINRKWRSRELLFVIGWLIGFAVIADFSPISDPIKWLIPFTAHARFRLFLCWFGAMSVAAALHLVRERAAIIAGVLAATLPLAFAIATTQFPSDAAKQATLIAAIPSAIALIAFLFGQRATGIVVATLFIELWFAGHDWNPVFPAKTLYPRTPLIAALEKLDHGERIVGIGGALFPNTNAIFGFADVRVHDPMANARYIDMLRRDAHYDTSTYYAKWNDAGTPLLNTLNVRWIVTEPRHELARHRLVYDGADGRIYENVNASSVRFENTRSDRTFWIATVVGLLTLIVIWSAAAMPPLWKTRS